MSQNEHPDQIRRATPDNRDVPYWWDASVSFAGPHERSDELRDGVVITILLSTRAETLSPAQWLEQKEGWWESTVYASQWIAKQGVRGLRTEERCTGCESSTTYYYFPRQRLLLVFAINVASTDATVRGQYQRLADRIYESFRLPTPTWNRHHPRPEREERLQRDEGRPDLHQPDEL